jgi:cation transport regulator ChaB
VEVQAEDVPEVVKEEIDESARKLYKLVKDAYKPIHDKTKYNKL